MNIEQQYLQLLESLLSVGELRDDRTGTGTLGVFGVQLRHHLSQGFPLLTTKKIHFKSVAHELLWFLKGDTNIQYLKENGVSIWNEWADGYGELGRVYGAQWCNWRTPVGGENQIAEVIEEIEINPYSRRLLVSAWNVGELHEMALPPCHYAFQFYVSSKRQLSCMFQMRSTDVLLGLPFNIASYALLTHMVAQVCGLEVGEIIYTGGDVHLYSNHREQAIEQLAREPRLLPTIKLNKEVKNIFDFKYEDFTLENYMPHPSIKAPVAI